MRLKLLTIGLICLYFVACMAAPAPRQITKAFPIESNFDLTWQAVIETFAELQFPILNMEKDSGLITTNWIQTSKDYCDCGKLGMNVEVAREVKFNVFVKKTSSDSCEVAVNCMFQQTYEMAFDELHRRYFRPCVSTGILEAEIFNSIKTKLGL